MKIIVFLILCVLFPFSYSQIDIPDVVFRNILVDLYDTDSDGEISIIEANNASGRLDGAHGRNITQLRVDGNMIEYIPELPHTLGWLNCSDNNLTILPELPFGLEILNCYENELDALPILPPTLTSLRCQENNLIALPQLNHTDIMVLYCYNNMLEFLPNLDGLINLRQILASDNNLIELPDLSSLSSLERLRVCNNNLTEMPILGQHLKSLGISGNYLTEILALPGNLTLLTCVNNRLTTINLSNKLAYINAALNILHELPHMPESMERIYFRYNSLTEIDLSYLDGIPNITFLDVSHNRIETMDINSIRYRLVTLKCNDNDLLELPDLTEFISLEFLKCYRNLLDESSCDVLAGFDSENYIQGNAYNGMLERLVDWPLGENWMIDAVNDINDPYFGTYVLNCE